MYNTEDLTDLEVAVMGVLSVGLPPSRAAGSDTFRVDHVVASVFGLQTAGVKEAHLGEDGVAITPAFRKELRGAIASLEAKGLVMGQASGMPAAAGGFEAGLLIDMVNPDEAPVLLDRFLSQMCMEQLFQNRTVYPYLMERYAASGEVWRRLRDGGYAND